MSLTHRQMEAYQDLPLRFDRGFPGSQEKLRQQYHPAALQISNFSLRLQHHQGNGAIRGRERMDHIASQGGSVANLWTSNQLACLAQRLCMLLYQLRADHMAECYRSSDEQSIRPNFQGGQFGDGGQIHQRVNRRVVTL